MFNNKDLRHTRAISSSNLSPTELRTDQKQGNIHLRLPDDHEGKTGVASFDQRHRSEQRESSLRSRSLSSSAKRYRGEHAPQEPSKRHRDGRNREPIARNQRSHDGGVPLTDYYRPQGDDRRKRSHYRPGELTHLSDSSPRPGMNVHRTEMANSIVNTVAPARMVSNPTWVNPQRHLELTKGIPLDKQPKNPDVAVPTPIFGHGFDYRRVPKGPKLATSRAPGPIGNLVLKVDKTAPHIFISGKHVPPLPSTVRHMYNKMKSCNPSDIQQDPAGYYIFWRHIQNAPASVERCFDEFNKQLLWHYTMEMQPFPHGQHRVNEPVELQRSDNQRQGSGLHFETAVPSTEKCPLIAGVLHSKSSVTIEEGQARISTEPRTLQAHDDLGSAKGARAPSENSSSASLSKSRRCHICKKASPLDATSLITCSACHRKYHKGCHKSSDSAYDVNWQCFYCKKAAHVHLAKHSIGSVDLKRPYSHPDGKAQASTKRLRLDSPYTLELNTRLAPDQTLPLGRPREIHDHVVPCQNGENGRWGSEPAYDKLAWVPTTTETFAPENNLLPERSNATRASNEDSIGGRRDVPDQGMRCFSPVGATKSSTFEAETRSADVLPSTGPEEPRGNESHSEKHVASEGPMMERADSVRQTTIDVFNPLVHASQSYATTSEAEQSIKPVDMSFRGGRTTIEILREWKGPRFTVQSLYEKYPEHGPGSAKHRYEDKIDEIRARPSRKQIFGKQGVSRLKGHDASARLGTIKLGLQRLEVGGKSHALAGEYESPGLTAISQEAAYGEFESEAFGSLEELLGLPKVVVTTLCDNQLAFRDGSEVSKSNILLPFN